jgi:hypothetical protein
MAYLGLNDKKGVDIMEYAETNERIAALSRKLDDLWEHL